MNPQHIISALPQFKGQYKLLTENQDTDDIITEILNKHEKTAKDYDLIAAKFWQGNNLATAKFLFDFLKKNVKYKIEGAVKQSVKSPGALLTEGYGDCKHYASFIVGVFEALKRQGKANNVLYRFASYTRDKRPKHVFAVLIDKGSEYFIDPVLDSFDKRNPMYNFKKDYTPGNKQSIGEMWDISGVNQQEHWTDMYNQGDQVGLSINPKLKEKLKKATQFDKIIPKIVKGQQTNLANAGKFIKQNVQSAGKDIKAVAAKAFYLAKKGIAAPSRNAFLGLMALNVFKYSTQLWLKGGKDKNSEVWKKTAKFWYSLGGNPDKLWDAMKNGVDTYNRRHKQKISGQYSFVPDMYEDYNNNNANSIGEPLTLASVGALLAAAAPVIAAITLLFNSIGVNKDNSWPELDPLFNPGASTDTATDTSAAPMSALSDGSKAAYYNPKKYLPATFDNDMQSFDPEEDKSVLKDFGESFKTFYEENKKPILITAGVLAAVYILPRVLDAIPKTKRRR